MAVIGHGDGVRDGRRGKHSRQSAVGVFQHTDIAGLRPHEVQHVIAVIFLPLYGIGCTVHSRTATGDGYGAKPVLQRLE